MELSHKIQQRKSNVVQKTPYSLKAQISIFLQKTSSVIPGLSARSQFIKHEFTDTRHTWTSLFIIQTVLNDQTLKFHTEEQCCFL